ncbi:MAG: nucleotidyl transferase AbiEii/AbiGii toxin family protein [Myxococcales bacterium]|nr:nucleotidyl transferase AbiEii/AbiGii toxin family protein [Myxococcales bacterium]
MRTGGYGTAAAFKQALEQRLRSASTSGVDFARRRQLVVFDRFLARVALELGDAVTLKGGLAVELRLERARTTKDVDLRVQGAPDDILHRLRSSAHRDLGDFMRFTIRPDDRHPEIQNDGMHYEGLRFRAECTIAGKVYGRPFGVDVAFGDPILGEPELLVANDALAFAGIEPPALRVYPIESHLAEKLHAYTMPRTRPNSRVKDLPDIALIATAGPIEASRVRAAIEQTFAFRRTHDVPERLPTPPESWAGPYAIIAREDRLRWPTLVDTFDAARAFMDPLLARSAGAVWEPAAWCWTVHASRLHLPRD